MAMHSAKKSFCSSQGAGLPLWVIIITNAIMPTAGKFTTSTIAAVTGIALRATGKNKNSGWMPGEMNSCR